MVASSVKVAPSRALIAVGGVVGAILAIALATALFKHPLGPVVPLLLGGILLILLARPDYWLFFVPALLPVADLAPWTGWVHVREFDLLMLAALTAGYFRVMNRAPMCRVTTLGAIALLLVIASCAISTAITVRDPVVEGGLADYHSRYNGLRIASGYLWAILAIPILVRTVTHEGAALGRYFLPGMVVGLAMAVLPVLWERLAFIGLFDFSSDYRVTGFFSETHTGGAGLDGYLALAIPFCGACVMTREFGRAFRIVAFVVLLGAIYAALVTYARSLYLALIAQAVVAGTCLLMTRSSWRPEALTITLVCLVLPLATLVAVKAYWSGGTRSLIACLVCLAGGFVFGGSPREKEATRAMMAGAILAALAVLTVGMWTKLSYLWVVLSVVAMAGAAIVQAWWSPSIGGMIASAAFPALLVSSVGVAFHWRGGEAALDVGLFAATAVALSLANRFAGKPIWRVGKTEIVVVGLGIVLLAMAIPVTANSFVKSRMSRAGDDAGARSAHWLNVIATKPAGLIQATFGAGSGSFPAHYLLSSTRRDVTGTRSLEWEDGRAHMRIGRPVNDSANVAPLNIMQRVPIDPGHDYRLSFEARGDRGVLAVQLCERWLIYQFKCAAQTMRFPLDSHWSQYEMKFSSGSFGALNWFGWRPVHIMLSSQRQASTVDIRAIEMRAEDGVDVIANGNFSSGLDRWFVASDHHHLPWHTKNLALHLWFESGWFGLASVGFLLLYALVRTVQGVLYERRNDPMTWALAAALLGILTIGFFDSVIDVPRVTFLLFLLLVMSMLRAPRRKSSRGMSSRSDGRLRAASRTGRMVNDISESGVGK